MQTRQEKEIVEMEMFILIRKTSRERERESRVLVVPCFGLAIS